MLSLLSKQVHLVVIMSSLKYAVNYTEQTNFKYEWKLQGGIT